MTTPPRFYNDTDHRQCAAADEQGLDCVAPENHDGPHANVNGEWRDPTDWRWDPDGNGGWISAPRHNDGTHCWTGPDCTQEHA